MIEEADDGDSEEIIALIRSVYAEYPDCILDVPGEEPELLQVRTSFRAKGGKFWVAKYGAQIVGTIAYCDFGDTKWELKKLYVHHSARRLGIASQLMETAEGLAIRSGVKKLVLWTDTRFVEAQAFYRARGFQPTGEQRDWGDISNTTAIEFVKQLPLSAC
jgi:GNAT superfamily N-acetyltransferase